MPLAPQVRDRVRHFSLQEVVFHRRTNSKSYVWCSIAAAGEGLLAAN